MMQAEDRRPKTEDRKPKTPVASRNRLSVFWASVFGLGFPAFMAQASSRTTGVMQPGTYQMKSTAACRTEAAKLAAMAPRQIAVRCESARRRPAINPDPQSAMPPSTNPSPAIPVSMATCK